MGQARRPKAFSAQEALDADSTLAASGHPALRPFPFSFPHFLAEPGSRAAPASSPIPSLRITQPTCNRDDRGGTEEYTLMQELRAVPLTLATQKAEKAGTFLLSALQT